MQFIIARSHILDTSVLNSDVEVGIVPLLQSAFEVKVNQAILRLCTLEIVSCF